MANWVMDTARMIEILPKEEQVFAFELVKRLVLAWDPDFSKATPEEAQRMNAAEDGGFVDDVDVDWERVGT